MHFRPRGGVISGMWIAACLALLSAMAAPLAAQPATPEGAEIAEPVDEFDSLSSGYADRGSLAHPFKLRSSDVLVTVRPHVYGTRELVGLIERAADAVAADAPGSRLAVGDLSTEAGGHFAPHDSHQSGRDADIGFYMLENNKQVPQAIFQRVQSDGSALRGERRFMFDDARNWSLLVALVDDPMAETQYIMIAPHIRARLLLHARAIGASEDRIRRVEVVTAYMSDSDAHDQHFHVRIYCSIGDRPACLDRPPLHPWYYGTPSPNAIAAARVADRARAAALRYYQLQSRLADEQLARGRAAHGVRERARALDLALERGRQRRAERLRAAKLTRDEREAVRQMRQAEKRATSAPGQGDAALAAQDRRWARAERQRARRLRITVRKLEADERKRAARMREQARAAERKAEAQQKRDRRRARRLLRRSDNLARELKRKNDDN